jgi:hypothetical protein
MGDDETGGSTGATSATIDRPAAPKPPEEPAPRG